MLLTLLTHHKAKFEWIPVHHTAFMMLKEPLYKQPSYTCSDPARRCLVYMDAFDDACGAQQSEEHDGTEFFNSLLISHLH